MVSCVILLNKVNYWIGIEGCEFEKEFVIWVGSEFVVVLGNGILVLDIVLKVLNVGKGDEVIIIFCIFLVLVSSIVIVGVVFIFVDVDLNS